MISIQLLMLPWMFMWNFILQTWLQFWPELFLTFSSQFEFPVIFVISGNTSSVDISCIHKNYWKYKVELWSRRIYKIWHLKNTKDKVIFLKWYTLYTKFVSQKFPINILIDVFKDFNMKLKPNFWTFFHEHKTYTLVTKKQWFFELHIMTWSC